jgi:hypothetical protein
MALIVSTGMGIFAPILRHRPAATVFAGLLGVVFAFLAISLDQTLEIFWVVLVSLFSVPIAAVMFAEEIRSGARHLCGDGQDATEVDDG